MERPAEKKHGPERSGNKFPWLKIGVLFKQNYFTNYINDY